MAETEPAPSNESGTESGQPYQVVARRFRPQSFEELVGQDEVLQSLRVALQQGRVPHAFVFSGSRGVGKTTSARILARCLNCIEGPTPEPCGTCSSCRSILDGSNPDVIEVDAASNNGVEDVRRLRESVQFATMQSRYRVVILDEAHMMSKSAFNAFLKTLEEPPPKVCFVLATTELHKLPDTIRSRCQVLLFRRVGEDDLQKRLRMIADKEGASIPDEVLGEIAMSVRGGVRDAETALERVLPLARELGAEFDLKAYRTLTARVGTDAVVEVVAALMAGDATKGLHFAHELQQHGTDERETLGEIVDMLRQVMLLRVDGDDSTLVALTGSLRERLQQLAKDADTNRLDAMIGAGLLGRDRLRRLEDRSAVFEVAMVRMAQAGALPTLADLLAEVRSGGGVGGAIHAQPQVAAPAGGGGRAPARAAAAAPALAAPAGARTARTAPAAPAARAAVVPDGPAVDGKDLKSRAMVRLADRKLLQATLELCRVDGPDDSGRVVVTLETERKMHQDRLKSPVIEQEMKQAIQASAGRDVQVELRIAGESSAGGGGSKKGGLQGASTAGATKKSPPTVQAPPGEKAKRVIDKFGGRVVQVNPQDRIQKPADGAGGSGAEGSDAGMPDPEVPDPEVPDPGDLPE